MKITSTSSTHTPHNPRTCNNQQPLDSLALATPSLHRQHHVIVVGALIPLVVGLDEVSRGVLLRVTAHRVRAVVVGLIHSHLLEVVTARSMHIRAYVEIPRVHQSNRSRRERATESYAQDKSVRPPLGIAGRPRPHTWLFHGEGGETNGESTLQLYFENYISVCVPLEEARVVHTHAIDQELSRKHAVEAGVDRALAGGVAGVEARAVAAAPAGGEAPGGRNRRVQEQVHRLQRDLRPVKTPLS